MKKPINTTQQMHDNPLAILAHAMAGGTTAAIEHQEAHGQQELVNSESIPYRGSNGKDRTILESWGFKFGEHDGQDLFIEVEMPAGWKKVRTDHSMWSNLLDDKGRIRASIFYKAAFYDRDAFMRLNTRYAIRRKYNDSDLANGPIAVEVRDGDAVLFSVPFPPPLSKDAEREVKLARYREEETWDNTATAWLQENYPNYKDAGAYWD